MFRVARKLLRFLDRRARLQLALLLVPMLVASVLEVVSIGAAIPLIQVAMEDANRTVELGPWLTLDLSGWARDDLLWLLGGGLAGLFVLKNVYALAVYWGITYFIHVKKALFQQRMFDLYLRRPYRFHLRRNASEIIRDLSQGIGSAFEGIRVAANMTMDAILSVSAVGLLVALEPVATLSVAAGLAVVGALFYFLAAPLLQRWGREAFLIEARIIKLIRQCVGAVNIVKITGSLSHFERDFARETDRWATVVSRSSTANQSPRFVMEAALVVGTVCMAGVLLSIHGAPEKVLASMGLFGLAALRLMPSMNRILSGMVEIRQRTALVDSIHADLVEGLADDEKDAAEPAAAPLPFEDAIRYEGVTFRYADDGPAVLESIDLAIRKGESLGIVGPSGAGKSTLVDIMLGLLRPSDGRMTVDGVDTADCRERWRLQLGYVPQHIYLLDDTLRRNVAFGIDDAAIDDGRVGEMLETAHLGALVAATPEGIDLMLGDEGARLSGGQRQRVGIARALYRDPAVLIFDEATSALDNETERVVSDAIRSLKGLKTLIIIAHRMSTVTMCDRLVFMRDGRIDDIGGFDELMARNATFRAMVQAHELEGDFPVSETEKPAS